MIGNFDARTKHSSGAAIPAQERYEAEYSEELRLNTEFNQFVANFRLAYQGPNTARAQIGAKYDTGELRLPPAMVGGSTRLSFSPQITVTSWTRIIPSRETSTCP